MMPGHLSLYITRRFLLWLVVIIAATMTIIFLAEYVEAIRRYSKEAAFSPLLGAKLAMLRAPDVLDDILPFTFLFAAMAALLTLSSKLELVIARASGVSVWGFLRAPMLTAALFGVLGTVAFQPLAVAAKRASENVDAVLSGSTPRRADIFWFRQDGAEGPSIVSSSSVSPDGPDACRRHRDRHGRRGRVSARKITAPEAMFESGKWVFKDARVISTTNAPRQVARYELPTNLTAYELRRSAIRKENVSVWSLPGYIETAKRTGISATPFQYELQALINRPFFLIAMVIVAATVGLRLTRYGGTWRLIATGASMGFLVYVMTAIIGDLGGHGIIHPVFAAWLPSIVTLTFGATALLHQEDG